MTLWTRFKHRAPHGSEGAGSLNFGTAGGSHPPASVAAEGDVGSVPSRLVWPDGVIVLGPTPFTQDDFIGRHLRDENQNQSQQPWESPRGKGRNIVRGVRSLFSGIRKTRHARKLARWARDFDTRGYHLAADALRSYVHYELRVELPKPMRVRWSVVLAYALTAGVTFTICRLAQGSITESVVLAVFSQFAVFVLATDGRND